MVLFFPQLLAISLVCIAQPSTPTQELNNGQLLVNSYSFDNEHEREVVHEMVSINTVMKLMRELKEQQQFNQQITSVLQESQVNFIKSLSILQNAVFELKEKTNRIEEAHNSNIADSESLTQLSRKLSMLEQEHTSFNDTQKLIIQNQNFMMEKHQNSSNEQVSIQETQENIDLPNNIEMQATKINSLETKYINFNFMLDLLQENFVHLDTKIQEMQEQNLEEAKDIVGLQNIMAKLHHEEVYEHNGDIFYINSVDKMNWHDAQEWCQTNLNGDLAQPKVNLNNFTQDIPLKSKIWLGGNELEQEGHWVWPDGTAFDDEFPWAGGQPNGGEPCLVLYSSKAYHDYSCGNHTFNFVCGFS